MSGQADREGVPVPEGVPVAEATSGLDPAPIDPRAVRVTVATTSRLPSDPTITVGPAAVARLEWLDGSRAILVRGDGGAETRTAVVFGPARERGGVTVREVLVDGWRIDVELESERRAALRERSRRATGAGGRTGPLEIHAIIPGRIVAVSVAPAEGVTAGQVLLVLEAMKMQNELRAPREGTIERVAVAVGSTVEVGDLLMVIS